MARLLGLCLVLVPLSCVGAGAVAQDGAMTGIGAAAGAAGAAVSGGSTLLIAAAAFVGSFILSLLDQAAEGQVTLAEIAPLGVGAVVSAFFWWVVLLGALVWMIPTPLAFGRGVLSALGHTLRRARAHLDDQPPPPEDQP